MEDYQIREKLLNMGIKSTLVFKMSSNELQKAIKFHDLGEFNDYLLALAKFYEV